MKTIPVTRKEMETLWVMVLVGARMQVHRSRYSEYLCMYVYLLEWRMRGGGGPLLWKLLVLTWSIFEWEAFTLLLKHFVVVKQMNDGQSFWRFIWKSLSLLTFDIMDLLKYNWRSTPLAQSKILFVVEMYTMYLVNQERHTPLFCHHQWSFAQWVSYFQSSQSKHLQFKFVYDGELLVSISGWNWIPSTFRMYLEIEIGSL